MQHEPGSGSCKSALFCYEMLTTKRLTINYLAAFSAIAACAAARRAIGTRNGEHET